MAISRAGQFTAILLQIHLDIGLSKTYLNRMWTGKVIQKTKKSYLILTSHSIIEWLYRSVLSFLFSVTFRLLILILIYNN